MLKSGYSIPVRGAWQRGKARQALAARTAPAQGCCGRPNWPAHRVQCSGRKMSSPKRAVPRDEHRGKRVSGWLQESEWPLIEAMRRREGGREAGGVQSMKHLAALASFKLAGSTFSRNTWTSFPVPIH